MNHPSYRLCNQTITVYNVVKRDGVTEYRKTVIENGAFLNFERKWSDGSKGVTASKVFTLIIPQGSDGKTFVSSLERHSGSDAYSLRESDKVMLGVGPNIRSPEEWAKLTPASNPDVVVIHAVLPQRGVSGSIVHVEAS